MMVLGGVGKREGVCVAVGKLFILWNKQEKQSELTSARSRWGGNPVWRGDEFVLGCG